MFSSRTPRTLVPNALSELLHARRGSGAAVLDLTESNPPRAGLVLPADRLRSTFDEQRLAQYEPLPRGDEEARFAVARYYSETFGRPVDPARIWLTASTSDAYAYLFKLLANPGDRVLVPRPSYPLLDHLAALESVYLDRYELAYDGGWYIDFESIESTVTPRTRALVVVHPNNPTGSFLKQDELSALLDLCARHEIALVCDEVFADYPFKLDDTRVATVAGVDDALVFALSGLSKVCAAPQTKLAWIAASGPATLLSEAEARLDMIADSYLSVSAAAQLATPGLLAARGEMQDAVRARTKHNYEAAQATLGTDPESPTSMLHVEGGWYLTLRVPDTQSDEAWALELLAEDDVLVQPGYFYEFQGGAYLVVSLLTPPETFRAGIERLARRVVVASSRA